MEKGEFELFSKAYEPIITKLISENIKFYRFHETIKWCFYYDENMAIMATCDRNTNVININLKSFMYAYLSRDLYTIEYYLLHEIRHVFQHLIILDYKNGKEIPINEDIVKKWIYEFEHYIKSIDNKGNGNPNYFLQDSEMDAYAFSYAVMKYKYNNIKPWIYENYGDDFWNLVNDWIETFKEEKL